MQKDVLMKCGHSSNAVTEDSKPCCIICAPQKEAFEIDDRLLNLNGREAQCTYCCKRTKSDINLPFFKYKPLYEFDEYYCGCKRWD